MTNLNYVELQQYLRDKVKDFALIKKTASIALGFALARKIPLPTSAVDYAEDHYTHNVSSLVAQQAAVFNEQIVVDIDLVTQVARSSWMVRYANAYPSELIPLFSGDCSHFFTKLAGAGQLINPEIHEFCEKAPELMLVLINRITVTMSK